jgi:putative membrane protein
MSTTKDLEKKYKPYVIAVSIVIPLAVGFLFTVSVEGVNLDFLPPVYASINGLTAILLVLAVISIKKGNQVRHQKIMKVNLVLSVLFLICYVAYHMTSKSTIYGDVDHNGLRDANELASIGYSYYVYAFLLLSHIMLSMIVLPLVLMTYLKGWANKVESHRKWAKITFPIWLYVAISGVAVYLMISPYYA